MKLNNLKPTEGSTHSRRRIGRGTGSGLGGTSTRGHKGAKSRSGYKSINHKEYLAINLSVLQKLAEEKSLAKIGIAELVDARITNGRELVKILGDGELKAKLEVEANAFSKSAEEAIKAVGGKTTII